MAYQVVWPRCNVFDKDGNATTLERGEFLPADIDETQAAQLATFGAVQFVDFKANVAVAQAQADQSGEPEDGGPVVDMVTGPSVEVDESAAIKPTQSANKADWVDYAVSQGMSRGEAEHYSRADLIEKLG
jgi:hypothetical protein